MNSTRTFIDRLRGIPSRGGARTALKLAVVAALSALVIFQAWAYFTRMQLWIGPRVLLQPWLIARGFVMYRDIVDLHAPLMPLILSALVPLFRDGILLAKVVIVALLSLSVLLTFEAARRSAGWIAGLAAAWFFVVWSPTFVFFKLWHESFLAPLYLLWLFFHVPSGKPRTVAQSLLLGVLGGAAVLIKQHAALPFAAFVVWNIVTRRHFKSPVSAVLRETGWILSGTASALLAFVVFQTIRAGSIEAFLFWTFKFNVVGEYKPFAFKCPTFAEIGVIASFLLMLPAALSAMAHAKRRGDPVWLTFGLLLLLIVTGSATAYPRFEFFHLQPVLSMIALTTVLTFAYVLRRTDGGRFFAVGVAFALTCFWSVTAGYQYLPVIRPETNRPMWEYSALKPLADEIRKSVPEKQSIYIFPDSEVYSNLYYLLRAEPPRFWVLHYPWYVIDRVRLRILRMLDDSPPEWIICFPDRYGFVTRTPDIDHAIRIRYRQVNVIQWQAGQVQLLKRIVPADGVVPNVH
jgi:hypothetical protein